MLKSALAVLLALFALGCVQTVKGRGEPGLADVGPIRRIAVTPFSIGRPLSEVRSAGAPDPEFAGSLIAHQLSEELVARGVAVVPPGDVGNVLRAGGALGAGGRPRPRETARMAASRFQADAVLIGEVTRFEERIGRAAGATRPAAVSFHVVLRAAPSGQRLWSGKFDERQKPLGSNVFDASRYPGKGLRWLTAEELAHWGATQVGGAVPLNR